MMSGILYDQGDIVIVPFPFSDLSATKQRPVLILSKRDYNTTTEDVITCGITSYLKDNAHSVLIDNQNLILGSMPCSSRIKVDKLFTVHQSIIRKKVGKVNKETLNKIREVLLRLV